MRSSEIFSNEVLRDVINESFRSSAAGTYDAQLQTFFTEHDRFGHHILAPNQVHSGLTFVSRPALNLQEGTIAAEPVLAPYLTTNPMSVAFAIRCWLDPYLALEYPMAAAECPFLKQSSPFFIPLNKAILSVSGFPDQFVNTYTTPAGLHEEDQTIAIGGDDLMRSYDINMSVKDVQYGPISAIFRVWLEYLRLATKGLITARKQTVDRQRLDYTVSIYRFTFDPTRRRVAEFGRAVGCFPKANSHGAILNQNANEYFSGAVGNFSIPFVVNGIKYGDYRIVEDFNKLVRDFNNLDQYLNEQTGLLDYIPPINENGEPNPESPIYPSLAEFNYHGVPYIFYTPGGLKLEYIDTRVYSLRARNNAANTTVDQRNGEPPRQPGSTLPETEYMQYQAGDLVAEYDGRLYPDKETLEEVEEAKQQKIVEAAAKQHSEAISRSVLNTSYTPSMADEDEKYVLHTKEEYARAIENAAMERQRRQTGTRWVDRMTDNRPLEISN